MLIKFRFIRLGIDTMLNTCLLCNKKSVERFPKEHIIPRALGGKIYIKQICEDCNHKMGTYIDGPIVNDVFMIAARYIVLSNIIDLKHPLEGHCVEKTSGRKMLTENINGKLISHYIPEFKERDNILYIAKGSPKYKDNIIKKIRKYETNNNLTLNNIKIEFEKPKKTKVTKCHEYDMNKYLLFFAKVTFELLIYHNCINKYTELSNIICEYLFNDGEAPFTINAKPLLFGNEFKCMPYIYYRICNEDKSIIYNLYNTILGICKEIPFDLADYEYKHNVRSGLE